jgi:hypothetical protein
VRRALAPCAAALVALATCARPPLALPAGLDEARRLLGGPRAGLRPIATAFERYQEVAAAAPEGPHAGEAAYALGLLALDLHLMTLAPFRALGDLQTRLGDFLQRRGVPAEALPRFAERVLAVARDKWQGEARERAERASELASLRERVRDLLNDLAQAGTAAVTPLKRYATLLALDDRHSRFVRSPRFPELVERAVLFQRVTAIHLVGLVETAGPCPVAAYLAKTLLGNDLDPDLPVATCLAKIASDPERARARLVRAAWVKLEEFALDRPRSLLAPLVRRLLDAAPAAARRPVPRSR